MPTRWNPLNDPDADALATPHVSPSWRPWPRSAPGSPLPCSPPAAYTATTRRSPVDLSVPGGRRLESLTNRALPVWPGSAAICVRSSSAASAEPVAAAGAVGVTAGTAEVVIATKLFRPNPRHQTVERVRLHDLLRHGCMLPLTLVVARPAGGRAHSWLAGWHTTRSLRAGFRLTAATTTRSAFGATFSSPPTRRARQRAPRPCGGWTRPAPMCCGMCSPPSSTSSLQRTLPWCSCWTITTSSPVPRCTHRSRRCSAIPHLSCTSCSSPGPTRRCRSAGSECAGIWPSCGPKISGSAPARHGNSSVTGSRRSCRSGTCSGCWRGPRDGPQACNWRPCGCAAGLTRRPLSSVSPARTGTSSTISATRCWRARPPWCVSSSW